MEEGQREADRLTDRQTGGEIQTDQQTGMAYLELAVVYPMRRVAACNTVVGHILRDAPATVLLWLDAMTSTGKP